MIEKKRDSERTKQRLLEAAERVFIEKGFDAARVDEIAVKAGVNKRLIYVYFGNKEDIYKEVLKANLQRLLDFAQLPSSPSRNILERATNAVGNFFNYLADNPGLVRLLAWESLMFGRWDSSELVQMLAGGLAELLETIEQGVSEGAFRSDLDVRQLVVGVVGLCLTYFQRPMLRAALWKQNLDDPAVRASVLRHIQQVVFEGIMADPSAAKIGSGGKK